MGPGGESCPVFLIIPKLIIKLLANIFHTFRMSVPGDKTNLISYFRIFTFNLMQTKPGRTVIRQLAGIQDKISFDIKKISAADLRRYLGKQKIL